MTIELICCTLNGHTVTCRLWSRLAEAWCRVMVKRGATGFWRMEAER